MNPHIRTGSSIIGHKPASVYGRFYLQDNRFLPTWILTNRPWQPYFLIDFS